MTSSPIAIELIRRQEKRATQRSSWESRWQETAELVVPHLASFQGNKTLPPDRRTDRIFDSTAQLGISRFAAALESLLTPASRKWHSLRPSEPSLQRNYNVRKYLEEATDILFRARYAPRTGFAANTHEVYVALGAFGTGPLLIEDDVGRGLSYRALHLQEVYLSTGANGMLDGFDRRYCYSARQARQRFRERTPAKVVEALDKEPEKDFEFLHVVVPNDEHIPGALGRSGMAFKSFHIFPAEKELIGVGGYRTLPLVAPRYITAGYPYGIGPCQQVLAEIKTANEIRRTILRQGQIAVDPPALLLAESAVLQPFNTRPGATNHGMVSPEGKPLAIPYQTGARFDVAYEELNACRAMIKDALLWSLFQFLEQDQKVQTATWVLERAKEKGILLAPPMGRTQHEGLGPTIGRELDVISAAGVLPPMPGELAEAGGGIRVEYQSDLAELQRAGEAAGLSRMLEVMIPIVQLKPEVLDVLDEDETMRGVSDVSGVPMRYLRSPEAMAQLRQARQQAQAEAQQAEMLPGQAAAERNFAMAEQTRAKVIH